MSNVTAKDLKRKLIRELELDYCTAEDLSDGCGEKFHVTAVGECFLGKSLIEQHRLVNETLSEELKTVHALTLKTMTPERFETFKQQVSATN